MASLLTTAPARLLAACLVVMGVIALLFFTVVDLRPQISPDFFFGPNDPELAQSTRIHDLFPADEFLVISAAGDDIFSVRYLERLAAFSSDLSRIAGISRLVSVVDGPETVATAMKSPFWRPLLISDDSHATLVIAFMDAADPSHVITEIEAAARLFDEGDAFHIRLSGMPYITEQIKRSLVHDFRLFSGAALAIFFVLLMIVFRSAVIALGASMSGITAVFLTLLLLQMIGQPLGILTANLAVIVFVLAQSQIIYLTSNWRRRTETDPLAAVKKAVHQTFGASFWCMVTTLLGFTTLLAVAAEPLRQLGTGGIAGALSALFCSFILYPVFLLFAARKPRSESSAAPARDIPRRVKLTGYGIGGVLLVIAGVALPGLSTLNTDPGLLSYFKEGSDIRAGLSFIDKNGGSSPLKLVVRRENGERLDSEVGYEAMWKLHNELAAQKEVGTVISLPALMAEANNHPLAFLLPWREIISVLSMDMNQRIADNFLTEDRRDTLFLLRMKEEGRQQDRTEITAKLHRIVTEAGFEPVLTGGVYVLQGRLSDLVAKSLLVGSAYLIVAFGALAWWISRDGAVTAAMAVTAALIPLVILGAAGWFRVPIDIISAPAATVSFGIAVDALIHLALALKRYRRSHGAKAAWHLALREQSTGVIVSTAVIAAGFVIFSLSGFPPIARFGSAIVLGAIFAGLATLTLFPLLAQGFGRIGRRA